MRRGVVMALVVLGLLGAMMLAARRGRDGAREDSTRAPIEARASRPQEVDREQGAERDVGDHTQRLQREIAATERRVAALSAEIAGIRVAGETVEHLVERCKNGGIDCPSGEAPQALLEAWAECGTLRAGGFGATIGDDDAARLGITEGERQRVLEIGLALQQADMDREEALAREATGEEPPEQPEAMRILHASSAAIRDATLDPDAIRRKLAREAAGLQEPPENPDAGPPYERILRMKQSSGQRFLEALERELGADRARELESVLLRGLPWGGTCPEP